MSGVKKILLMGKSGCGKSAMRSIIFANSRARDTTRLGAITMVRFLGNLNLWDCEGHDNSWSAYLDDQRDHVFSDVEAMIWVFSIMSASWRLDLIRYRDCVEATLQNSPSAKLFVLIHNMDKIKNPSDRLRMFETRRLQIIDIWPLDVKCFKTSVWDETLYEAWSVIVQILLPGRKLLERCVEILADEWDCAEIAIFERATFLMIASVSRVVGSFSSDIHRFEKTSNIMKQWKLSCSRACATFHGMELHNRRFSLFTGKARNFYMVAVFARPVDEKKGEKMKREIDWASKWVRRECIPPMEEDLPQVEVVESMLRNALAAKRKEWGRAEYLKWKIRQNTDIVRYFLDLPRCLPRRLEDFFGLDANRLKFCEAFDVHYVTRNEEQDSSDGEEVISSQHFFEDQDARDSLGLYDVFDVSDSFLDGMSGVFLNRVARRRDLLADIMFSIQTWESCSNTRLQDLGPLQLVDDDRKWTSEDFLLRITLENEPSPLFECLNEILPSLLRGVEKGEEEDDNAPSLRLLNEILQSDSDALLWRSSATVRARNAEIFRTALLQSIGRLRAMERVESTRENITLSDSSDPQIRDEADLSIRTDDKFPVHFDLGSDFLQFRLECVSRGPSWLECVERSCRQRELRTILHDLASSIYDADWSHRLSAVACFFDSLSGLTTSQDRPMSGLLHVALALTSGGLGWDKSLCDCFLRRLVDLDIRDEGAAFENEVIKVTKIGFLHDDCALKNRGFSASCRLATQALQCDVNPFYHCLREEIRSQARFDSRAVLERRFEGEARSDSLNDLRMAMARRDAFHFLNQVLGEMNYSDAVTESTLFLSSLRGSCRSAVLRDAILLREIRDRSHSFLISNIAVLFARFRQEIAIYRDLDEPKHLSARMDSRESGQSTLLLHELIQNALSIPIVVEADDLIRRFNVLLRVYSDDVCAVQRVACLIARGNALAKHGLFRAALDDYEEALKVQPNSISVLCLRIAQVLEELGEWSLAEKQLELAMEFNDPDVAERGRALLELFQLRVVLVWAYAVTRLTTSLESLAPKLQEQIVGEREGISAEIARIEPTCVVLQISWSRAKELIQSEIEVEAIRGGLFRRRSTVMFQFSLHRPVRYLDPLSVEIDFRYPEGIISSKGASGVVRHANMTLEDGSMVLVAAKIQLIGEEIEVMEREVRLLSELTKHPNLITCFGCYVLNDTFVTVFEYCDDGNVFDWLNQRRRQGTFVDEDRIASLIEIAQGVHHLHSHGIIHLDLKVENILVKGGVVKIIDLDMSKHEGSMLSFVDRGTPRYVPNRNVRLSDKSQAPLIDTYAFGILAHELWSGERAYRGRQFRNQSGVELIDFIHQRGLRPDPDMIDNAAVRDLLVMCWSDSLADRPFFGTILVELRQIRAEL